MNILFASGGAALAVAILAAVVLGGFQTKSSEAYTTQSVRVGDAGNAWMPSAEKK